MTVLTHGSFRTRLISELTQLDQRESRRYPNMYRLGLYLEAGQATAEAVDKGADAHLAFADHFMPPRGMHTIARHLGLPLDVQRGRWVDTTTGRAIF
jgi:hypothetical protein